MGLLDNQKRRAPKASVTAIFVAVLMSTATGHPQDLRPYDPPSRRPSRYDQFQTPAQALRPAVDEAVYERFRGDVQTMNPQTRKKLTDALQQRLDRARQEGRDEEVKHNQRLLEILGNVH